MSRLLTQRELRNQSGEIMRALDEGESFVVTRNGVPVGELTPITRATFARTSTLKTLLTGIGGGDAKQFRDDLDTFVDQDPTPRA